jgi:hypothetical protein
MTNNVKYRHEFKYQCSEAQLAIIQSRIETFLQHDPHAKNGQYTIRSMYFDNYAHRCFFENESGTSPREKFRIRIYNSSDQRISLECKRKEYDKIYKTACLLTMQEYEDILQGGNFIDLDQKPALLKKFTLLLRTQQYKPDVIVEYDRIPYVYPIGNVRITLDKNIRFSTDFNHFFSPNIATRPIMLQGQHLLEIKYDELLPTYIEDVLQLRDLQRTTFSKFYLCRKLSIGGRI